MAQASLASSKRPPISVLSSAQYLVTSVSFAEIRHDEDHGAQTDVMICACVIADAAYAGVGRHSARPPAPLAIDPNGSSK